MSKFICNQTGFSMAFSNGIRISVQFGEGNYCSNRYEPLTNFNRVTATTAEIAIMPVDDKDGAAEWFNFGGDGVKGWVTADEVADWIGIVSDANSFADLIERRETILHVVKRIRGEEE
tara:strand:+ start:1613 stop:1966 length:354 start_codon:yes stop_codon:yes gene_type:complete